MNHTPGPWKVTVDTAKNSDGEIFQYARIEQVARQFTNGRYMSVSGCIDEHDARLIAAAPELLEALKPFANVACLFDDGRRGGTMPKTGPWQSWPRLDGDYELTVEDLQKARAAIAKATITHAPAAVSYPAGSCGEPLEA